LRELFRGRLAVRLAAENIVVGLIGPDLDLMSHGSFAIVFSALISFDIILSIALTGATYCDCRRCGERNSRLSLRIRAVLFRADLSCAAATFATKQKSKTMMASITVTPGNRLVANR
jgi:hypothetical protein